MRIGFTKEIAKKKIEWEYIFGTFILNLTVYSKMSRKMNAEPCVKPHCSGKIRRIYLFSLPNDESLSSICTQIGSNQKKEYSNLFSDILALFFSVDRQLNLEVLYMDATQCVIFTTCLSKL